MYCTRCGVQQEDTARYCAQCGTATANAGNQSSGTQAAPPPPPFYRAPSPDQYRPLLRSRNDKWIAGVCSGLARYWGLDPVLVRILFVALALCPVLPAIIPYIVCWIVMPQEPSAQTFTAPAVPQQS